MLNLGTLYSTPFTPIYSQKLHSVDLQLTQASCDLAMKQLARLGEPEARLGELGSRKLNEKNFLPPPFGIFCIPDLNIELSFILCDNWCRTTQFG